MLYYSAIYHVRTIIFIWFSRGSGGLSFITVSRDKVVSGGKKQVKHILWSKNKKR